MNVLYNRLPDEINGWRVNFDFRVGVQLALVQEDPELNSRERWYVTLNLLFATESGRMRKHPNTADEINDILSEYMTGWNKDNTPKSKQSRKLMDYDIDQWRIYADFRQIYGINLNTASLHWWEFQAMLWNMPFKKSSFLQAVEIRGKKYGNKMSAEEKTAIRKAKEIYALKQPEEPLTAEEEKNAAEFMAALERGRLNRKIAEDFLK